MLPRRSLKDPRCAELLEREFVGLMITCKGLIVPESLRNTVLNGAGLHRVCG